ncbi:MAG: GntR family transcriptional regulator [Aggregatilineales bacterium]
MVATSDAIAEHLRQAILRGELKSLEPLPQDKIANDLGVSKVPLREALAELKSEGLIIYKANRGAFVTALSSGDAKEIYLMRVALEQLALEYAIPNLSKVDIAHARSALLMIDAEDNAQKWAELNWEFHAALYRPAEMPHLIATIKTLHVNVGRYLVLYLDKMAFQNKSHAEHHLLLEACISGNTEHARHILQQHLDDASYALQNYLNSENGGTE